MFFRYDLILISDLEKRKIINVTVGELKLVKRISRIYVFGGKKYVLGVSDVDFIIIVNELISLYDLEKIRKILQKNTYLCYLHPPFIFTEDTFQIALQMSCLYTDRKIGNIKLLYARDRVAHRNIIPTGRGFSTLSEVGNLFSLTVFFRNDIRNFKMHFSLRAFIKTVKNFQLIFRILSENITPEKIKSYGLIEKTDHVSSSVDFALKSIYSKSHIDKQDKQLLLKTMTDVFDLADVYTTLMLAHLDVQMFISDGRIYFSGTLTIWFSNFGIIFFAPHETLKLHKNVFLFFQLFGVDSYDINLAYYMCALIQSNDLRIKSQPHHLKWLDLVQLFYRKSHKHEFYKHSSQPRILKLLYSTLPKVAYEKSKWFFVFRELLRLIKIEVMNEKMMEASKFSNHSMRDNVE
ncbi:hypothetical protein HY947_04170 [Candidatus Gottesmanbacteria bacterium]|nr:hypothetical protein [Candidatus Gottesmanbacteria bacterium]